MSARNVPLACALALLVACGELRRADPTAAMAPNDASPPTAPKHDADAPTDGGPGVPPVVCTDCLVETVLERPGAYGPIAVDDTYVYVSELGKAIFRCAKTGCETPTTLFAQDHATMTLADGKVWTVGVATLSYCKTTGCGGTLTNAVTESGVITEVTTDGTRLVWRYLDGGSDVLRSCPAANCTADTAVTLTSNYHMRVIGAANGLVAWISSASAVATCKNDATCAAPRPLGSLALTNLALNADTAFWTTESSEIAKCALAGCNEHPTIVTAASDIGATAADATHVYWRSPSDSSIRRCTTSGCAAPETVATDVTTAAYDRLALDEQYVYWSTSKGVFRRRK